MDMLVIADDLTGAADCGIACGRHGLRCQVALETVDEEVDVDVLSFDANTRHLDPRGAAIETARIIRSYPTGNRPLLFKKIDSTLRGNFAAELAAALEVHRESASPTRQKSVAILAPAFPAQGRTTSNGRQFLNGRPLADPENGRDFQASRSTDILGLLCAAGLRSSLLNLELIRSGTRNLRAAMNSMSSESDVLLCDSESDSDLRSIAEAGAMLRAKPLWAGSAGLAYHVPIAAGLEPRSHTPAGHMVAQGPSLFVVGSVAEVSRHQASLLASAPNLITIEIPAEVLVEGPTASTWHQHVTLLQLALASGSDALVLTGAYRASENGRAGPISTRLAQLLAPFSELVGALVVTGGETARSVLDTWGVSRLRLIEELEPGFPYAITEGWTKNLLVFTKAGGFGNPYTLQHCVQFLRQLNRAAGTEIRLLKGC